MKKLIIPAASIIAVVFITLFVYSESSTCDICDRPIDEKRGAIIKINFLQWKNTCCPVCAFRYINSEGKESYTVLVRDFHSDKLINSKDAYYVVESNERGCCSSHLKRFEAGTFHLCYDRCMPNAIAFERKQDAMDFVQKNGGRVITYYNLRILIVLKAELFNAPIAQ